MGRQETCSYRPEETADLAAAYELMARATERMASAQAELAHPNPDPNPDPNPNPNPNPDPSPHLVGEHEVERARAVLHAALRAARLARHARVQVADDEGHRHAPAEHRAQEGRVAHVVRVRAPVQRAQLRDETRARGGGSGPRRRRRRRRRARLALEQGGGDVGAGARLALEALRVRLQQRLLRVFVLRVRDDLEVGLGLGLGLG